MELLLTNITGALLLAEQLGGAVVPEEQGPSPSPPALFEEVGPLVADWEKYLRNMAEELDKQHTDTSTDISSTSREYNIFLQVGYLLMDFCQNVDDVVSHHVM